jgi:hypothetical protein
MDTLSVEEFEDMLRILDTTTFTNEDIKEMERLGFITKVTGEEMENVDIENVTMLKMTVQ